MIETGTFLFTTGVSTALASLLTAIGSNDARSNRKGWVGISIGMAFVVCAFGFEPRDVDIRTDIASEGGVKRNVTSPLATLPLPDGFESIGPIKWNYVAGSYKPHPSVQRNQGRNGLHVRCRESIATAEGETIILSAPIENESTGTKIYCGIGGTVSLVRVIDLWSLFK